MGLYNAENNVFRISHRWANVGNGRHTGIVGQTMPRGRWLMVGDYKREIPSPGKCPIEAGLSTSGRR